MRCVFVAGAAFGEVGSRCRRGVFAAPARAVSGAVQRASAPWILVAELGLQRHGSGGPSEGSSAAGVAEGKEKEPSGEDGKGRNGAERERKEKGSEGSEQNGRDRAGRGTGKGGNATGRERKGAEGIGKDKTMERLRWCCARAESLIRNMFL